MKGMIASEFKKSELDKPNDKLRLKIEKRPRLKQEKRSRPKREHRIKIRRDILILMVEILRVAAER